MKTILNFITYLTPIIASLSRGSYQPRPQDLSASYCAKSTDRLPICCNGRVDSCSRAILNSLCYCDSFCINAGDCCPDFSTICTNGTKSNDQIQAIISTPFSTYDRRCQHKGKLYTNTLSFKDNCNECKCQNGRIECAERACLIREDFIDQINNKPLGWIASNYSKFWGMSLRDGLKYKLGSYAPDTGIFANNLNVIGLVLKDSMALPTFFDARKHWGPLINAVREQHLCASSWAISTADVASDRLAIQTRGLYTGPLSAQHLISCNQKHGCTGGHVDKAWQYLKRKGIVSEECIPYKGLEYSCSTKNNSKIACDFPHTHDTIYKFTPPYRVPPKDDKIRTEILMNGPVQATMFVEPDFFIYKSGVYQHSNFIPSLKPKVYHSVRILGWGEDDTAGLKYWLVANSWGKEWGEDGYFRIARGNNECGIESYVIGVWARNPDNYN